MTFQLPSLPRRKFLKAAGGVAVGLPFLETLQPKGALAAPGESRFVVLFTPNGSNNLEQFMPQGNGSNFTLGMESGPVLPFKSKLLALSGVDMQSAIEGDFGDKHSVGMGHMLTARRYEGDTSLPTASALMNVVGFANGISIDQEIANAIGTGTRYKSLQFGVQSSVRWGNHPFSRMTYAAPNQPIPPEDSPLAAYTRLFGGVATEPSTPGMLEDNLRRRRSVLDYVIKEFERVNATVSGDDKARLDQHLSMIREVERGLQSGADPSGCKGAASFVPILDHNLHVNFPKVASQQADLLVLALSCGLTRVASLQYSYARSNERLEWVSTADCVPCGEITEDHHTISHKGTDAQANAQMVVMNRWYAEQVAYVLGKMDAIDEGGTTLLYNSLALWCSEVSYAADHTYDNIRAFIFGTAGGKIKTGQHIAYNREPHNKLHVTLLNAMGIPATAFGDPVFGSGPLAGILV